MLRMLRYPPELARLYGMVRDPLYQLALYPVLCANIMHFVTPFLQVGQQGQVGRDMAARFRRLSIRSFCSLISSPLNMYPV